MKALDIAAREDAGIRLLLTDYIMPVMNGRELSTLLAAAGLHVPIIFMTGYTDDSLLRSGALPPDIEIVEKPISIPVLLRRVHEVLTATRG